MIRKRKRLNNFSNTDEVSVVEKLILAGYGPGGRNLLSEYEEKFGKLEKGEEKVELVGPEDESIPIPKSKLPEVLELISNHPSKKTNVFFKSPTNDFREKSINPNLYSYFFSDEIAESDLIFVCDLHKTEHVDKPTMIIHGLHIFWVHSEGRKRASNVAFSATIPHDVSLYEYTKRFFDIFRACMMRGTRSKKYSESTTVEEIDSILYQIYKDMWDLEIQLMRLNSVPKNIQDEFNFTFKRKYGDYSPVSHAKASEWILRIVTK